MWVYGCEPMSVNKTILGKINRFVLLDNDFLSVQESKKYDKIIANPPFAKNQDIDHIHKMYSVLADAGRIVTLASKHWQHCNNKKEREFAEWLHEVGAEVKAIPD